MRTPGKFVVTACLGWLALAVPAAAQEDFSK